MVKRNQVINNNPTHRTTDDDNDMTFTFTRKHTRNTYNKSLPKLFGPVFGPLIGTVFRPVFRPVIGNRTVKTPEMKLSLRQRMWINTKNKHLTVEKQKFVTLPSYNSSKPTKILISSQ
jgi:hypothetical protein